MDYVNECTSVTTTKFQMKQILSTMHAQTISLLCLQEICNKLLSQGVCRAEVRVKAAQGKAESMTAATKEDCVLRQQPPRWADSQEEGCL
jgi:hypothetical protein